MSNQDISKRLLGLPVTDGIDGPIIGRVVGVYETDDLDRKEVSVQYDPQMLNLQSKPVIRCGYIKENQETKSNEVNHVQE